MTIATYNLDLLFDAGSRVHSGKEWHSSPELIAARVAYFAERFKQINADVLLLQEVASAKLLEQIVARSGIDYQQFLGEPDVNGIGNAVLYRQPSGTARSIPAVAPLPVFVEGDTDTLGPRVAPRRDIVHLSLPWNERTLHVLNVHLKSNFPVPAVTSDGTPQPMDTQLTAADGVIRSELFRLSQAKRVRHVIDEIFAAEPRAAIVVGGDMNAEEMSGAVRIIRGPLKRAADALVLTSHHIPLEQRYSHLYRDGRKVFIDHLLVSQSLDPLIRALRVLNEGLAPDQQVAPTASMIESDHAPVILELSN